MGIRGTGRGLGLALVVFDLKELISRVMVLGAFSSVSWVGVREGPGRKHGASCS